SFEVRLDLILTSDGNGVEFGTLDYDDGCALQPNVYGGDVGVIEYCKASATNGSLQQGHKVASYVPSTAWYVFSFAVDFSTRMLDASVTLPGGSSARVNVTLSPKFSASLDARVYAGISYAPVSTPGQRIRMDDV